MEVIDRVLENQEKEKSSVQLPKLANFTLHHQNNWVQAWKDMGWEIDPTPRAPLINLDNGEWTEEKIFYVVLEAMKKIRDEKFDGVLLGGLSNAMIYAWYLANMICMKVIMARTPRERTPDGHFVFTLKGWTEVLTDSQLSIRSVDILPKEFFDIEETKEVAISKAKGKNEPITPGGFWKDNRNRGK